MDKAAPAPLFMEKSGRLKIYVRLLHMGKDPLLLLYGGDAHLGALALACPHEGLRHCSASGHMDHLPALDMAERISKALGKRVGVCCGIHYDNLTRPELTAVLKLCARLTDRIIRALSTPSQYQERPMLDVNDLDKFADFIRSGALEEKFKCGSEETRGQILELLEKLMDVAELADECATRLIFRSS